MLAFANLCLCVKDNSSATTLHKELMLVQALRELELALELMLVVGEPASSCHSTTSLDTFFATARLFTVSQILITTNKQKRHIKCKSFLFSNQTHAISKHLSQQSQQQQQAVARLDEQIAYLQSLVLVKLMRVDTLVSTSSKLTNDEAAEDSASAPAGVAHNDKGKLLSGETRTVSAFHLASNY